MELVFDSALNNEHANFVRPTFILGNSIHVLLHSGQSFSLCDLYLLLVELHIVYIPIDLVELVPLEDVHPLSDAEESCYCSLYDGELRGELSDGVKLELSVHLLSYLWQQLYAI